MPGERKYGRGRVAGGNQGHPPDPPGTLHFHGEAMSGIWRAQGVPFSGPAVSKFTNSKWVVVLARER
jgi:hypothetical protein